MTPNSYRLSFWRRSRIWGCHFLTDFCPGSQNCWKLSKMAGNIKNLANEPQFEWQYETRLQTNTTTLPTKNFVPPARRPPGPGPGPRPVLKTTAYCNPHDPVIPHDPRLSTRPRYSIRPVSPQGQGLLRPHLSSFVWARVAPSVGSRLLRPLGCGAFVIRGICPARSHVCGGVPHDRFKK